MNDEGPGVLKNSDLNEPASSRLDTANAEARKWVSNWLGAVALVTLIGALFSLGEIGISMTFIDMITRYFGGLLLYAVILAAIGFMVGLLRSNKTDMSMDYMDGNKVLANSYVLQNGSYELAESRASFDETEKELLEFATDSIKKIDPIGGIPLGFSHNVVATYPDVIVWMSNLPEEKFEHLLGSLDDQAAWDQNSKIKPKYLRMIIDAYKEETGAKLECLAETT